MQRGNVRFDYVRWLTRVVCLPVVGIAVVACGGESTNDAATVTQTVQATTTDPTRVSGPVGLAANAPFAEWQLVKYDPDLKQFGDYYAKEFCEKPEALYSINVSSQEMPIEYAFYQNNIGKPSSGLPVWADDIEVKSMLGQYMVTHYCPVKD